MQLQDAGGQLASRPAPNALNAPGWANNSPATSAPTIADPDWANAVSAELLAFLSATGLAATKTNVAQVLQAATILFGGAAQCRLNYSSGSQVVLAPRNGNAIRSAGVLYLLAAAGVIGTAVNVRVNGAAGQSLAASTAYYVSYNGAEGTLNYWALGTYGHAPDTTAGNIGTEVITSGGSPLTAETLVGLVWLNSAGHFLPLCVSSWFNRKRNGESLPTATPATGSTSYMALAGTTMDFVCWAEDAVHLKFPGSAYNGQSGATVTTSVAIDGVQVGAQQAFVTQAAGAAGEETISPSVIFGPGNGDSLLTEGHHQATAIGMTSAGTAQWSAGMQLEFSA